MRVWKNKFIRLFSVAGCWYFLIVFLCLATMSATNCAQYITNVSHGVHSRFYSRVIVVYFLMSDICDKLNCRFYQFFGPNFSKWKFIVNVIMVKYGVLWFLDLQKKTATFIWKIKRFYYWICTCAESNKILNKYLLKC